MDTGTTTSSRPPGTRKPTKTVKRKLTFVTKMQSWLFPKPLPWQQLVTKPVRFEMKWASSKPFVPPWSSPPVNRADPPQFAVQQIIDRAVVSTEIVDILGSAGLSSPDISILSEDLLSRLIMVFKLLPQCTRLEISKKLLYLDRAILGKNSILPIGIGCTRR